MCSVLQKFVCMSEGYCLCVCACVKDPDSLRIVTCLRSFATFWPQQSTQSIAGVQSAAYIIIFWAISLTPGVLSHYGRIRTTSLCRRLWVRTGCNVLFPRWLKLCVRKCVSAIINSDVFCFFFLNRIVNIKIMVNHLKQYLFLCYLGEKIWHVVTVHQLQ